MFFRLNFYLDLKLVLTLSCKIWVAGKFAPGVYTLAVSEALPEEMQVGIFLFLWYIYRLHSILLVMDFKIYYDILLKGIHSYFFSSTGLGNHQMMT